MSEYLDGRDGILCWPGVAWLEMQTSFVLGGSAFSMFSVFVDTVKVLPFVRQCLVSKVHFSFERANLENLSRG